jgi:hypothetical protein
MLENRKIATTTEHKTQQGYDKPKQNNTAPQ